MIPGKAVPGVACTVLAAGSKIALAAWETVLLVFTVVLLQAAVPKSKQPAATTAALRYIISFFIL